MEQCRQKRYEVAQRKLQPRKIWVAKKDSRPKSVARVSPTTTEVGRLPTIDENKGGEEEVLQSTNATDPVPTVRAHGGVEGSKSGDPMMVINDERSKEPMNVVAEQGKGYVRVEMKGVTG